MLLKYLSIFYVIGILSVSTENEMAPGITPELLHTSIQELITGIPHLRLQRLFDMESFLEEGMKDSVDIANFSSLRTNIAKHFETVKQYQQEIRIREGWYKKLLHEYQWNDLNNRIESKKDSILKGSMSYFKEATKKGRNIEKLQEFFKQIHNTFREIINLEDEMYMLETWLKHELKESKPKVTVVRVPPDFQKYYSD